MMRKNKGYLFIMAAAVLVVAVLTVNFKAKEASIISLPDFNEVKDETVANEVPVNTLADVNEALTEIVDETIPSVVTLKVSESVKVQRSPFPPMFRRFFGRRMPSEPEKRTRKGIGSGVIVSKDGYILTNAHVVAGAENIIVTLSNGRQYDDGKVVGYDKVTDIAVVKIDAEGLNPIPIGNSDKAEVGEMVLAIGSPLGQQHSVSFGIISAKGRQFGRYSSFIQTDAAINPGNSGGALVNMSGQLIGINTAIISQTGGYQGIGLAIPSNMAKAIMRSIIDDGEVERAYLGVSKGGVLDATMARALGVDITHGVIISNVVDGSPADEAGLQPRDIIYKVNDNPIDSFSELATIIGTSNPGEEVELNILRDGERINVTVTLAEQEKTAEDKNQQSNEKLKEMVGFEVHNLTSRLAQKLKFDTDQKGVVVTDIRRMSDAFRQGLRKGDVIINVSNQPVENYDDFVDAINNVEGEDQVVLLQVLRAGRTRSGDIVVNKSYIAFEL